MPNLISRGLRKLARQKAMRTRIKQAASLGITFEPPNFVYRAQDLRAGTIVIDVGCANDPDFSKHLMARYQVTAWGVDPTRKHGEALQSLERETQGRFRHLPVAVAANPGKLTFHESEENLSGSLLQDHGNVLHDHIRSYEVEAVDLLGLLARLELDGSEIIKLDLEGAEYDLLAGIGAEQLAPFRQIFVEFHHHCFDRFSVEDTVRLVRRLEGFGLSSFTVDDHNYLFYRS